MCTNYINNSILKELISEIINLSTLLWNLMITNFFVVYILIVQLYSELASYPGLSEEPEYEAIQNHKS